MDTPELSLRLFQVMQRQMTPPPSPGTVIWEGRERTFEEFLKIMVDEGRLIYEFEITRVYGLR